MEIVDGLHIAKHDGEVGLTSNGSRFVALAPVQKLKNSDVDDDITDQL